MKTQRRTAAGRHRSWEDRESLRRTRRRADLRVRPRRIRADTRGPRERAPGRGPPAIARCPRLRAGRPAHARIVRRFGPSATAVGSVENSRFRVSFSCHERLRAWGNCAWRGLEGVECAQYVPRGRRARRTYAVRRAAAPGSSRLLVRMAAFPFPFRGLNDNTCDSRWEGRAS